MILWWIRLLNEFEVNGNSLERIQQYLTIEHEPKPTAACIPPAYWPASGSLIVEKLSARYSADGPRVLHEISFEVKAGERVGIGGYMRFSLDSRDLTTAYSWPYRQWEELLDPRAPPVDPHRGQGLLRRDGHGLR